MPNFLFTQPNPQIDDKGRELTFRCLPTSHSNILHPQQSLLGAHHFLHDSWSSCLLVNYLLLLRIIRLILFFFNSYSIEAILKWDFGWLGVGSTSGNDLYWTMWRVKVKRFGLVEDASWWSWQFAHIMGARHIGTHPALHGEVATSVGKTNYPNYLTYYQMMVQMNGIKI